MKNQVSNLGKEYPAEVVFVAGPTVRAKISHFFRHPLYRKSVRRSKSVLAHNESLSLVVGEKVILKETRPISKRKHFIVLKKISE